MYIVYRKIGLDFIIISSKKHFIVSILVREETISIVVVSTFLKLILTNVYRQELVLFLSAFKHKFSYPKAKT